VSDVAVAVVLVVLLFLLLLLLWALILCCSLSAIVPSLIPPSLTVTPEGLEGLVKLSTGDMRKALNILQVVLFVFSLSFCRCVCTMMLPLATHHMADLAQSTSMAFSVIDETAVYACTGKPLESDIASMMEWMLNDSFSESYRSMFRQLCACLSAVQRSSR
jgi:hypothetical protein